MEVKELEASYLTYYIDIGISDRLIGYSVKVHSTTHSYIYNMHATYWPHTFHTPGKI